MEFEDGGIRPGQRAEAIRAITKAGDDFERTSALVGKLGDTVTACIALNLNSSHDTVPNGVCHRVA
jgi:hypothetical protein